MDPVRQLDPKFTRAMQFAQNFTRKHGKASISNLYVIQRIDLDGNVVDEKYGMNLMTDYGLTTFFSNSLPAFPKNLYVGQGGGGTISFDTTTNTLITPLTTTPATNSNTTIYYNFPMYYDNTTGMVTTVCQYLECYLDYNFDDWYQDVSIYEYGIGTANDALWTHSWVYDNFGGLGMVTKKPNERLVFTVYLCMSYRTNLINTEWNNGKYVVITSPQRFFGNHMREDNLQTYKRYSVYYSRGKSNQQTAFDDTSKSVSIISNLSEMTIIAGETADTGYVDGFRNISPGFVSFERAFMNPICNFDVVMKPDKDTAEKPEGFSDTFGKANFLPFTQVTMSNSYTYNPSTQLYDLPDTFLNDPNRWYDENSMEHDAAITMYYSYHDTATPVYVYINMKTDDPILKIEGNLLTVYATNEYWDRSKWVFINDLSNVPNTCEILDGQGNPLNPRCMKYWITSSNLEDLKPVRASQKFTYTDANGDFTFHHYFSTVPKGFYDAISSKQYQWFMVNNAIYTLSDTRTTTVSTSTGYSNIQSYTCDTSILTFISGSNSFIVTDMTQSSVTPSTIQNTAGISNLWACYRTDSKNGRAIVSDYAGSNLLKIDYRDGSNVTQTGITNCSIGCMILNTENYAMIDSANPKTILVKNFDTDASVTSFTVTGNNPVLLFGYGNQLYVSDCSTYMIICDIVAGTMTTCGGNLNSNFSGTNRSLLRVEAATDFMILYRYDQCNTDTYAYVFEKDRPTLYRTLGFNPGDNYHSNAHIVLRELNKTANGVTTVLILTNDYWTSSTGQGCRQISLDLGRYMKSDKTDTTGKLEFNRVEKRRWIPYGDHIICEQDTFPIANLIPHRIVGTTNTVSTVDNIKNIRDKRWTTTISNISEWQGKPPGNQM